MLPKAPADVAIEIVDGDYNIGNGLIHARVLNGPRFHDRARPVRTAVFVHGGGIGSNHTQVDRPSRWLIARGLFDQVILPDRRGSGASSALAHPMRLDEQADDLRRLLDRMNIGGPLTVLGMDVGGPVALVQAGIDNRVACVVLVASAPRRVAMTGLARWMLRVGLLRPLIRWEIRRSIGKREPHPVNFDPAYDARSPREMAGLFREALGAISEERAGSLEYETEAELQPESVSVPPGLRLDIPILQIIGEGDEAWGGEITSDLRERFPFLARRVVPGAWIHKDVFYKAEAYYQVLFEFLQEACPGVQ
jgi:pimeloyl-ACP methyl ester carboxylesterase